MKHAPYMLVGLLISSCTSTYTDRLQPADLVFVSEDSSEFSEAISAATSDSMSSYTHVGIIDCKENGDYVVIEAEPKNGVSETPLDSFLAERKHLSFYRVISGDIDPEEVILKARSFLGEPYDYLFLPDNHKMYCSELVYESYLDFEGHPIFKAQPMNFRDKNGEMPKFWIELYQKENEEIPEGILGTNPNDLSKSPQLVQLNIKL